MSTINFPTQRSSPVEVDLSAISDLAVEQFNDALSRFPGSVTGRDLDVFGSLSDVQIDESLRFPKGFTKIATAYMTVGGASISDPATSWKEAFRSDFLKIKGK